MKLKAFLACAAIGYAAFAGGAAAQTYPAQPINLFVPYAAGGATDVIARLLATDLSKQLKQPIVVVNKPGAGTTLAASEVARSKPDGYSLYMTTAAHTISASLYRNLRYDPIKDFAPITLVARIPIVLVVNPSLKVNTLAEYIAYAKKGGTGLSVGSPGNGSPQHLASALFQARTGTELLHIPYRGDAPLINDLLAGSVESAFITLSAALPHIQSKGLRAIALANPTRINAIPDVPTMTEAGLDGFSAATWFGLFGPAGIDASVQSTLHQASSKVITTPEFTQRIENMGGQIANLGPDEFRDYVKAESEQWAKAVEVSGARVD
ncbi:MAG: tripartite tricarboxylate transporter substrate binding protein [Burkholderiaceae bacterium]